MKILYIPLDERPCNALYPIKAAQVNREVAIISPEPALLGQKKTPGNPEALQAFVREHFAQCDCGVFSGEMLLYGGLLPSRLHHFTEADLRGYREFLEELHADYPEKKIYLSNLIMRTPRYNSADEEPDYYEVYGERIFRYGWLKDKADRDGLSATETAEWQVLQGEIPEAVLADYEARRAFNVAVNLLHIELVAAGVLTFLSIPQDDSAPYGYTALDQKRVYGAIAARRLKEKIMVYPGADEVGFTLLARAFHEYIGEKPHLFVRYSSTLGPELVPLYEDRPMNESLKAHVMAAGFQLVESSDQAEFILAYNTPGKVMEESWDQLTGKDITYDSYRHLLTFVQDLGKDLAAGKKVALCDSAFANGGELELVQLLDETQLLEGLMSYKAWNTNCNSLGSSLAALAFCRGNYDERKVQENLLHNLFEDLFYQALIRMTITREVLPDLGLTYFDLQDQSLKIAQLVQEQMLTLAQQELRHSFSEDYAITSLAFPWKRMFEIQCEIKIGSEQCE